MPFVVTLQKVYKRIANAGKSKKARELWAEALLNWAGKSRFNSRIYYLCFSQAFLREQQAYLYGRMKYKQNLQEALPDQRYMLRRNIHRLEKGLLMRPRHPSFARDYITETVNAYRQGITTPAHALGQDQDPELQWAHDVIDEYFQVVESHPIIERARQNFYQAAPHLPIADTPHEIDAVRCIPYQRNLSKPLPVAYSDFLALSERRRAVRWYLPQPVARDLLDQAITAAAQAPSACNRQPFMFYIFDDPRLVSQVAQLPIGIVGYEHTIPVLVVIVGRLRAYEHERDRHLIYVDGSLAAMAFMLALETLGLSSCPIHWPDLEVREQAMATLLQLEADERPIMLLSVGYADPDGAVAYSQKKSLAYLRRYNFE